MSKLKKFTRTKIRKITGGKDPVRIVEEFMTRRGFDPEECLQQRTAEFSTWSVTLNEEEELEITLEGMQRLPETTLYMGVNVMAVPIKNAENVLIAALTVADTLIGAKLSLVNYDLVLSITVYAGDLTQEETEYLYELISRQKNAVSQAILEELGE